MKAGLSRVHGSDTRATVGTPPVWLWTSTIDRFLLAANCASGTSYCACKGVVATRLAVSGESDQAAVVGALGGRNPSALSP